MVMAVETADSVWPEAALQRALLALPTADLRVHVSDGQLQICGTADTWHEKQRAQELLRRLCPDIRIRNAVRVATDQSECGIVRS
ncbi:MAG: BON domain-containing protein [Planctomycetota bacterium]